MSNKPQTVLNTLVEMQRILYSADDKRSPALILRYYNQAWLHSILLKELVKQPKKLTLRKLFGVYFHNLSAHGGIMLHIISGQASNAEQQERIFNHIKRITRHTSNYHPGQIIPNLFVRLQAEREMGLQEDDAANQQAQISNLSKCLPSPTNTCVPLTLIQKHCREWQAHLQQISNFLLEGEGAWWSRDEEAVVFNDIVHSPSQGQHGQQLHHFRSSSLSKEKAYIQQCWEKCVRENITIPAYIIRVDQEDGSTKVIHTTHLEDKNGHIQDCEGRVISIARSAERGGSQGNRPGAG